MSGYKLEQVSADRDTWEGIVKFLACFEDELNDEAFWAARVHAWWVTNPAFDETMPRGWVLFHDEQIVGFLGTIAMDYLHNGIRYKALAASTWRVAEAHREVSMNLFFQFFNLRKKFILLNTTANTTAQKIFNNFKFTKVAPGYYYWIPLSHSKFSPLNVLSSLTNFLITFNFPDSDLNLVRLTDEFIVIPEKFEKRPTLCSEITREYLEWYCLSPGFLGKEFFGLKDSAGVLVAFIVCEKVMISGIKCIRVVRHGYIENESESLLYLIEWISSPHNDLNFGECRLLAFPSFGDITFHFPGISAFTRISRKFSHYYKLPSSLAVLTKECQFGEGDYGC